MLSDVCSVLVNALTEGKDDSPGNMTVKYSEEPYRPPPEPTEKQIEKTRDLLGRMREATEKEPEQ
jgi:hypothetical protein